MNQVDSAAGTVEEGKETGALMVAARGVAAREVVTVVVVKAEVLEGGKEVVAMVAAVMAVATVVAAMVEAMVAAMVEEKEVE